MAIDDYKNVRISFFNRIKTELDGGGRAVKYEGLDFDTQAQTQWFEAHVLNGLGLSHRADMRNESWLFQIDCFAKTGPSDATPVKIWELVGITRDAFDQKAFPLRDWDSNGDPIVGYLKCGPMSAESIPTNDDHLMRVSCTVTARLNE